MFSYNSCFTVGEPKVFEPPKTLKALGEHTLHEVGPVHVRKAVPP